MSRAGSTLILGDFKDHKGQIKPSNVKASLTRNINRRAFITKKKLQMINRKLIYIDVDIYTNYQETLIGFT
jgi:hypothetical protein